MTLATTLPLADTWGMHGDIGAGWWIVMVAAMVVFWGVVLLVGIRLLRGTDDGHQGPLPEPPLTVLQRRLAEGTISVEEYEQRRNMLTEPDRADTDVPAGDAHTSAATSCQPTASR